MPTSVVGILTLFFVMSARAESPAEVAATAAEEAARQGWEKMSEGDGIVTYRRETPGSPLVAFRGDGEVEASIAKLMQVFSDSDREKEWTDETVEAWNIRAVSEDELLSYNHTHTPWPLKDRDFVILAKHQLVRSEKSIVIRIRSVEDPAQPDRDCCVRGEILDSAYVLREIEEGKRTYVTVSIQVDPKGSVPKWVVNLFQKAWPRNTLESLRRQVAKPDVGENPKFVGLFKK